MMTDALQSDNAPRASRAPHPTFERLDQMLRRAWDTRWRIPATSNAYAKRANDAANHLHGPHRANVVGRGARLLGWHERWKGNFEAARQYFETAESTLAGSDLGDVLVEAMAGRSVVLYSQGKQDEASDLIRKALTLLGQSLDPSTRVDLFIVQATIISYSGAFDDALALTQEAIDLAKTSGAVLELSQAKHIKARILMRKGSFEAAMAPARLAVEHATQSRNRIVLPYAYEVLAAAHLASGDFAAARDCASQAVTLGQARGDQRVVCQSLEVLGRAERQDGNTASALDIQRQGLAIAKQIDYPLWQRLFQLEIADLLEADGRFEEALAAYKTYSELDQDLFRRETETRMAEMHTKFDLLRANELAEVERTRAEDLAQAWHFADHAMRTDGLTKITNREGFDQFIEASKILEGQDDFTYVVIDLDRFKPINDTFGHAAGDAVLVEIASRLQYLLGPDDLVSRIGGDEFALILTGSDTCTAPRKLGDQLVAVFAEPVTFGGRDLWISASIGIATSRNSNRDLDRLMSSADQAMYAAKAERHTSFMVYDPEKFGETINLNTMATVRQAIRTGEIQPWYQPKIDIRTNDVVGFEALARWVKPDGTVIAPSFFLPLIEQHNLQTEFTFSIFKAALDQISFWAKIEGPTPHIAINMVEEVLASPEACNDLCALLDRFGDVASLITFEITEEVFFDRGLTAIQASIRRLSDMGVQFSMDDFGTGYGSFSHLCNLEVHELKIDTEFVRGIGIDRSAEVIIDGFISIARGLGLGVTAEGIETKEQAEFLVRRGCDIGQGFLYSAALPDHLATAFLTDTQRRTTA